jgi:hypothetical protein
MRDMAPETGSPRQRPPVNRKNLVTVLAVFGGLALLYNGLPDFGDSIEIDEDKIEARLEGLADRVDAIGDAAEGSRPQAGERSSEQAAEIADARVEDAMAEADDEISRALAEAEAERERAIAEANAAVAKARAAATAR